MIKQPRVWANMEIQFWETRPDTRSDLWKFMQTVKSPDVLELGCGIGTTSQLFDRYIGVDISPNAIAEAQRRYPKGTFYCANFLDLDIEPHDTVLCYQVLEHQPHFDGGLRWIFNHAARQVVIANYTGRSDKTVINYANGLYDNLYAQKEYHDCAEFYGWKMTHVGDYFNGHNKACAMIFNPR